MTVRKSTVEEIRAYFDSDVEHFDNLQTGQVAAVDGALVLQLIAEVAKATTPQAGSVLDVGCGAGNFTLKLLHELPNLNVTLVDLSQRMLARAVERIRPQTRGSVTPNQCDIREADLGAGQFDIILASAVLHHLRTDDEWHSVFRKFYAALRPGGSIWIFDLVESITPAVQSVMWRRYGDYLIAATNEAYRDEMFQHIEAEDTPKSVPYQLDLLREVGFRDADILHRHATFAAFGAIKPSDGR